MKNTQTMLINEQPVLIGQENEVDYINIVQLAAAGADNEEDASQTVSNWIRSRNTMDYLATWEKLYGAGEAFQEDVYQAYAADASRNSFSMSPLKWVETTHAIGIKVKRGRGGGVFAHKDLALEFCTWLNPVFKLYVVREFQRIKEIESRRQSQDWSVGRMLSKVNYQLHTDAIKDNIIAHLPSSLQGQNRKFKEIGIYASEADMLNKIVFGLTAAEWRAQNTQAKPRENVRDYATARQLVILSNMENLNAMLMEDGHLNQRDRFRYLADKAARQFSSLSDNVSVKRLKDSMKALDEEASQGELPAPTE